MNFVQQIAKQFRDVHFGGNWTAVNLKDSLKDVSWEQAIRKVQDLNSIAVLVFHINYYVNPVMKVLQGEHLQASDKFSFDSPLINSEEDWKQLTDKMFTDAELFAQEIEKLDEDILANIFSDPKYGTYYRNIAGLTEHIHYHLGQIVLIKKLLA